MANPVISGAILLGYWAVALFFLRFWKKTGDRFFLVFACAFGMLCVERLLLVMIDPTNEKLPYVYIARLLAYLLIITAIVDKNRARN
jgi:hypothetical protein